MIRKTGTIKTKKRLLKLSEKMRWGKKKNEKRIEKYEGWQWKEIKKKKGFLFKFENLINSDENW